MRTMSSAAAARAIASHALCPVISPKSPSSAGSSATTGMTAMSWNSSTAKASRPAWLASSSRSASIGSTIAVDDSARPNPTTTAAGQDSDRRWAMAQKAAPVITTCAAPSPSTERRITQSRCGRSSSPMRKSSMTTPSSETSLTLSVSLMRPSPAGPMTRPAAR